MDDVYAGDDVSVGYNGRPDALSYYYPGSCLVTGRDIVTLWVARMVVTGLYNLGDVPFTDVFLHATILDGKGAKQLLGMGDMLYMDRGGQPQRVHGCYVSEEEIFKVTAFIKKQARPVYNHQIAAKRDEDMEDEPSDRRADPLYDKAVQIVAETRKVSTSMIQRRLNIGYNRAAKIVEQMEVEGVIGPARGTAPREVLVQAA